MQTRIKQARARIRELSGLGPNQQHSQIQAREAAKNGCREVHSGHQQLIGMQHFIELEYQCRQGGKAAAEAHNKQQSIVASKYTLSIEPGGRRGQLRQDPHDEAADDI